MEESSLWVRVVHLSRSAWRSFRGSRTRLTARITDVVRWRKYVRLRSPGVIDAVVCQSGQVRRCGVVVQATCLPFGMRAQDVQQSCHDDDLSRRMRVAGIDYMKRSPYICSFRYCLNVPENLPASRNVLSLAIIYVRRHRGRTLFGDWRSHRSLSARYNRRSS